MSSAIASDLRADTGSAVAPTLQFLLTKMWARAGGSKARVFDLDMYRALQQGGYQLGDMLREGLEAVCEEDRASGLAVDVLEFHTTEFDTAAQRSRAELEARYPHRREGLDALLRTLEEKYLLIGTEVNGADSAVASPREPGWPTTRWPPWCARSSWTRRPPASGPVACWRTGPGNGKTADAATRSTGPTSPPSNPGRLGCGRGRPTRHAWSRPAARPRRRRLRERTREEGAASQGRGREAARDTTAAQAEDDLHVGLRPGRLRPGGDLVHPGSERRAWNDAREEHLIENTRHLLAWCDSEEVAKKPQLRLILAVHAMNSVSEHGSDPAWEGIVSEANAIFKEAWSSIQGECLLRQPDAITALAYLPGRCLYTGSVSGKFRVWNLNNLKRPRRRSRPMVTGKCAAWSSLPIGTASSRRDGMGS